MDNVNSLYAFSYRQIKSVRREQATGMPFWLKRHRNAYRDWLMALAEKSFEETGIWFLARGAERNTDEQETAAVWGNLLCFVDLKNLPGYSEENHRKAIEFWQSWQNLKTGQLYNPLYQDPQNPQMKRNTPGNRDDYSPERINLKYIPGILLYLGAELPMPLTWAATQVRLNPGEDVFDNIWKSIALWNSSHAGAFPWNAACDLDAGCIDRIPQIEAGMGALLRTHSRETGMWRPEPLKNFPWRSYQPSSGFKIIARICGYAGMENFPEKLLKTAVDNLLEHHSELYDEPSTARNYGELFAHYLMLSDYRRNEQLDAMEECLNGFRDPAVWKNTATAGYCLFGSGLIGAFMNWKDLPLEELKTLGILNLFVHGCEMKWRFVADPYGNWINVLPKEPEEILGHSDYDVNKYGIKARNKTHWTKKIIELVPQQNIILNPATKNGAFAFTLTPEQITQYQELYLKATWNGAYDISLNGVMVKQVRYNLPDVSAGWYIPLKAAEKLRPGTNTIDIKLLGPGNDQKPGAPLSHNTPFIRLGLIGSLLEGFPAVPDSR